ncbi:hypothetical protein SAMN05421504_103466 [Amycolatopsis xylanica]|uniref:Subtilisin inhibitor-like n=1 Tax=Amycolatopsis xylanica TaxID=589385 RepID=A0A1H3DRE6_9PSEU|nr:hypothetical protein [Amycolatopsis xylanica]SDX68229.1 hypothetical protein SAMN05421504_103466 [Amycolatopsis xylanica]
MKRKLYGAVLAGMALTAISGFTAGASADVEYPFSLSFETASVSGKAVPHTQLRGELSNTDAGCYSLWIGEPGGIIPGQPGFLRYHKETTVCGVASAKVDYLAAAWYPEVRAKLCRDETELVCGKSIPL